MSIFLGNSGNIRLKRRSASGAGSFQDRVTPDDVNQNLARVGLAGSLDNLVTGDRVEIRTDDPRGLLCFSASNWSSATVERSISGYVNVNALGGLRFYPTFSAAVNNTRTTEYPVTSFAGDPIEVSVSVRDTSYGVLGCITDYELNTSRDSVDTTSLSDKFRSQYSAGLITGSGRINCLFDYKSTGISEVPLLLLQTIQRVELGSSIDVALYLVDKSVLPSEQSVFYEFEAVVTQAGVTVSPTDVITCSIDFLTTGDIKLLIGEPDGYVLKEDDDRIQVESSLDFLLKETDD